MADSKWRDYAAGGLASVVGLAVAVAGSQYDIGTLRKMGPGFFPFGFGLLLIVMGVLIALTASMTPALAETGPSESLAVAGRAPDWRGWSCIIGGIVAFIVLAAYAGLLPATFVCVFVVAMADRTATVKSSAVLAVGVTAFGLLLFSYFLGIQIPVLRGL
jgi:hypothetical protein